MLLGEQQPDGQWQWYFRDPQTDAPLFTLINGIPYHYELDWRGMPIRLWAEDGSLAWQANADAWGKCQPEGEVHQPIRLPGQFADELTGLYFNRFRDYDPETGRYLTPDPLGIKGGLNSYRYTRNPVDYIDPLGLTDCDGGGLDTADAVEGEEAAIPDDAPEMQEMALGSPRERIPEEQRGVFAEFEQHHEGQFSSDEKLVEAFEDVRDNQSPWPVGYEPRTRTMAKGETFNMIVDHGAENTPGKFGTQDSIPDSAYGREKLAIKQGWKGNLDQVVEYEARRPFDVEEGPVGPQVEKLPDGNWEYYPGGGTQVTFADNNDWAIARPNKYNANNEKSKDPLLDIVSKRKL